MREYLSGIEARNQGIAALCAEIAPDHRVMIAYEVLADEDLDATLTEAGLFDSTGTPLWIYGATLPRALMGRISKVQVHEPFDGDGAPPWFDHRLPDHVRETSVPGYSCFSPEALENAAGRMLDEYARVRLKDPNGASGVGQWTIGSTDEIDAILDAVASDVKSGYDTDLAAYLAEYGYVVEADMDDVEAWSVTMTRTPHGPFSSFGRQVELTVELDVRGVVQNYGGTSIVVVRGEPADLECVPAEGAVVDDPAHADGGLRLAPSREVIRAAQRYIESVRCWETEGAYETRANVDVITGTLVRRNGERETIAASVEDSGRVGGASPAELLGITDLLSDPHLPYAVRSTRHGFDATARTYSQHAPTVAGSRVFWDGVDANWDGKHVFIGAF